MAAVTGTIVALGGLGVSAAQAIGQNKAMKKAQAASDLASKELKAINEQNAFKQLQVPTLGTQLAQQSQAQRESQAVNMLQGAGAEGVIGGIGQLAVAGEQGDLQNAARLDELKFERDAMQSQAQQGINSRKQQRDFEIGFGEKADAEAKRAQAEANRNAAIESAVGFAGSALTSASKLAPLYKENKGLRNQAKDLMASGNTEGANQLLGQVTQNKADFQTEETLTNLMKNNPDLLKKIMDSLK
jgi:hypothetical protein